jgi:26S proteasome subunit RPN7
MVKKEEGKGKKSVNEDTQPTYPLMRLSQEMHRAVITNDAALIAQIFEEITVELENPFLYSYFRQLIDPTLVGDIPAAKATAADLQRLEEKNQAHVKELEAAVEVAKESAGDTEVMEAYIAIAQFKTKSCSKPDAIAAYEAVLALPKLSSGKQIDIYMCLARIASFYSDPVDVFVQPAHTKAEQGGGADWDRRNRLKIYRALSALVRRDCADAAALLRDCLATFNATEYCTYTEFMVYTLLTNVLFLSRPELKQKMIDGPEVITIQGEIPQIVRVFCVVVVVVALCCCSTIRSISFRLTDSPSIPGPDEIGALPVRLRLPDLFARHVGSGVGVAERSLLASPHELLDAGIAHSGLQAVLGQLPVRHLGGHGAGLWRDGRLYRPPCQSVHCRESSVGQD